MNAIEELLSKPVPRPKKKRRRQTRQVTPERVCQLLEWISMHAIGGPDGADREYLDPSMVYTFTHIARKPECLYVHGDWVDEFLKMEREMLDGGW